MTIEGEVGPNEVIEAKNGMMTTYSLYESDGYWNEDEEEPADIEDLKFVLAGKFEHFETREEFKEFIEDLGGTVSSSVSKNTHFVICNDEESTSKAIEKAKELCIPIITENAFICKFADPYEFDDMPDEDEVADLLWWTTCDGGFQSMECEYGVGTITMHIWKKGKWVRK